MKKVVSISFISIFILILISSSVFADLIVPERRYKTPSEQDIKTPPSISNLEIHDDQGSNVWIEVTVATPKSIRDAIDYFENHEKGYNQAGYIAGIELEYSIDGRDWETRGLSLSPNYDQQDDQWNGIFETEYLSELHVDSQIKVRARYNGVYENGDVLYSNWSNELVLNEKVDFNASEWALKELQEADKNSLIPNILKLADLTGPITRREFAHVAVKLYEQITGTTISSEQVLDNPFIDTDDNEVLKAYKLEITKGTSDVTFSPDKLITREEMATMIARALSKVGVDSKAYDPTARTEFSDHNLMHDWSMDAIYFMADREIIKGVGDGSFGVNGTATREQALLISERCYKAFKK